ncbi:MAG: PASTA domain-containing protein [Actinomycetales bacterium]|nr:PASTA domain-containing protein [Actinomycetales bacterium]
MSDTPRLIAGRYELGNLIGRGGMADVYEGVDTRLGRTVAIKLLKSDLANDPTFEARFRQEAQASARMAHPTIVRVYDAGEDLTTDQQGQEHKRPFIIMEFVRGRLLRDLLHERHLPIAESLEYVAGVLTALEFSHRAGVIHRDIKSANVMINEQGQVKVMDFGIARAVSDSSATMAQTSGIMGTAQYFSPEQAKGETVDARTDLYSTGVLLYEMLAGRPPFKGDTAVSVAYQHVSEAVVPPSQFNPEISAELDQVVLHALAKDRTERFQTAEEFREHMLAAAAGTPMTAPQSTLPVVAEPAADAEPATEAIAADEVAAEGLDTEAAQADTAADNAAPAELDDDIAAIEAMFAGGPAETAKPIAGDTPIVVPVDDFDNDLSSLGFNQTTVMPAAELPVAVPTEVKPAAGNEAFGGVSARADAGTTKTKHDEPRILSGNENPFESLGVSLPTDTTTNEVVRTKSNKPSPGLLWGLGSAGVVVVVGLLVWLFTFGGSFNLGITGNGGTSVADVTNQPYATGIATLEGQGLMVTKTYEVSDTVPADSIIRTDPVAGTKVPPNTTITVYVSTGKNTVQMPDLTGMDETAATAAIAAAKLTLGTITPINSASVKAGLVVLSDPLANSQVPEGTVVNLSISNGQVMVPDVRNLDIADAQSRLQAVEVGFTVSIQPKNACVAPQTQGTVVLEQSIPAGVAPQGSAIVLYVDCKN